MKTKAVVTDYIEDDLEWEKEQMAKAGIDFAAHQLKFKPEAEVLAKIEPLMQQKEITQKKTRK